MSQAASEGEVLDVRAADGQHTRVLDAQHPVAEDARAQRCPSVVDYCRHYDSEPDTRARRWLSDDQSPRPVVLTDELKAQLGKVSTATLTQQLQRRGVRSTFLSGLKPVVERPAHGGIRPHVALRAAARGPQRTSPVDRTRSDGRSRASP